MTGTLETGAKGDELRSVVESAVRKGDCDLILLELKELGVL